MDSKIYCVFIDEDTHREVKTIAAKTDMSIKRVVNGLLRKALGANKVTPESVLRSNYKTYGK